MSVIQLHLSGGEPLVRRHIIDLVREARRLGLYSNMSTGATVVDEAMLDRLREAGLDHLQVSLLDTDPESNDYLAGARSFDRKRDAVLGAKQRGFPVTQKARRAELLERILPDDPGRPERVRQTFTLA